MLQAMAFPIATVLFPERESLNPACAQMKQVYTYKKQDEELVKSHHTGLIIVPEK